MSMRLPSAVLGAALLLLAGSFQPTARAKPPELPVSEKMICLPHVAEQPTGVLLFGAGINSDGGLSGSIQLQRSRHLEENAETEVDADAGLLDTFCECLGEVVDTCLETFVSAFIDVEEPGAAEDESTGAEPGAAAPGIDFEIVPVYMLGPDGQPVAMPAWAVVQFTGVDEAAASRYGPRATGRIASVTLLPIGNSQTPKGPETSGKCPETSGPEFTCPYLQQKQATSKHTAAREEETDLRQGVLDNLQKLEEARKLCRKAERCCDRGRLQEACACYEKVQRLCPGSRFGQQAQERLEAIHARLATEASDAIGEEQELLPAPKARTPEKIPAPRETDSDEGEVLRPALPAVDPTIVEVLENVLTTVETPLPPQLVIIVEDKASEAEEQEEPTSAAPGREPCPDCALHTFLRQAAEVALYGSCTELRCEPSGCLRGRCQFQGGGLEIRMVLDGQGHVDFDVTNPLRGTGAAPTPAEQQED